ncbi:hypothetical protein WDU94_011813 [Cyamophila willieti]
MVKVNNMIFVSVLLVIGCANFSSGRRPYFSDEDDAVENLDEEETTVDDTSLPEVPRPVRRLHHTHAQPDYEVHHPQPNYEVHHSQPEYEVHHAQPEYKVHHTHAHPVDLPEDEEEVERETAPPPVQQQVEEKIVEEEQEVVPEVRKSVEPVACTCGIFMSGQFQKASKTPPKGNPIVMTEMEETYQCNPAGNKQCINKCLEMLIKHLPNSPSLICAAADRNIYKERAYLFVKNCKDEWHNSNLSAGREYCCQDNEIQKCPSS